MQIFAVLFFLLVVGSADASLLEAESGPCPDGFTGLISHPMYCQFFYFCTNGQPDLRECPEGLFFNPASEVCDFPANVDGCDGGTRETTASTTASSTTTTEEQPITEPVITTTTPGSTTTTTERTTTTTTVATTTTKPPGDLTCPPNPSIFMPYPGDCEKYYYCENGNFIGVGSCQDGLWFQFYIQACRSPWGSDCTQ